MQHNQPLNLDTIETRATSKHLTPGPWRLEQESCDCGGDYPCGHGMYVTGVSTPTPTEIAAERCKRTGEQPRDYDFHRSEIGDFTSADWELMVHAREDVPALVAELRRLRTELAAAQDRITELETYANGCDAEGCVLPHSSWCEAAKKTAAKNDGCTCGRPWKGHPQPHAMHCWTVNPPRNEVEEMRKRIAELTAVESLRRLAAEAQLTTVDHRTLAAALDGLHTLIATSSRDWQTYRVDAWLWAVLCGWDCEQDEHDDTCTHGALEETAAMHGWDADTVAKARRYRAAVRALTDTAAEAQPATEALCRCGHGKAYHDAKYADPQCRLCPEDGERMWRHTFTPATGARQDGAPS